MRLLLPVICKRRVSRINSGILLEIWMDRVTQINPDCGRSAECAAPQGLDYVSSRNSIEIRRIGESFVQNPGEHVLTLQADHSYHSASQFGFSS